MPRSRASGRHRTRLLPCGARPGRGGPAGGAARAGGARGFAGVRVEPRPAALFPRLVGLAETPSECAAGTRVPLLGKKCWPGVARCRAPPPRFCQVKMTEPRRAWGAAWRDRRGEGRRAGGRAPKGVEKYSSFLGFSNGQRPRQVGRRRTDPNLGVAAPRPLV